MVKTMNVYKKPKFEWKKELMGFVEGIFTLALYAFIAWCIYMFWSWMPIPIMGLEKYGVY